MLLLDHLLTAGQVSVLALFDVIVVLQVELNDGTLQISKLDFMLNENLVHDASTFNHHDHLSLLLACDLETGELFLCLELHLDLLDDNFLSLVSRERIWSGFLTSHSDTFVVCFHLLNNFFVLNSFFH